MSLHDLSPGPLFDLPPVRQRPTDTTMQALDDLKPRRRKLQEAVLAQLRRGPATDEELCAVTQLSASTIRPRRGELVESGEVVDSGHRRGVDSGKQAIVWRLATADEMAAARSPEAHAARIRADIATTEARLHVLREQLRALAGVDHG